MPFLPAVYSNLSGNVLNIPALIFMNSLLLPVFHKISTLRRRRQALAVQPAGSSLRAPGMPLDLIMETFACTKRDPKAGGEGCR